MVFQSGRFSDVGGGAQKGDFETNERTHPNGRSVRARTFRIASLVSTAFRGPVAKIPTPPAFETAATSSGVLIHDIPGSTTGYLQLKSFVIRVVTLMMVGIV